MLGLLSDLPRKNCRTIAEWAGDATLDGMQHLHGRAKRDADPAGLRGSDADRRLLVQLPGCGR
ncbi:MAG: hypothetical protein QOD82_5325 [Pseudonocardiales bacterium]|jgi:hypothetical protein|nr:hypothetical protein [Pseudonocardiales bacterium]